MKNENIKTTKDQLFILFRLFKKHDLIRTYSFKVDFLGIKNIIWNESKQEEKEKYWIFLKNKYNLPDLRPFFDNIDVMFNIILYGFFTSFKLELDRKYKFKKITNEDKPNKIVQLFFKLIYHIKKYSFTITTIFLIFIFTFISYIYDVKEEAWLSSLFLGLATSLLITYLFTQFNIVFDKKLKQMEEDHRIILNLWVNFKESFNKERNEIINLSSDISDEDFLANYLNILNLLDDFIYEIKGRIGSRSHTRILELNKVKSSIFYYLSRYINEIYYEEPENNENDKINKVFLLARLLSIDEIINRRFINR